MSLHEWVDHDQMSAACIEKQAATSTNRDREVTPQTWYGNRVMEAEHRCFMLLNREYI